MFTIIVLSIDIVVTSAPVHKFNVDEVTPNKLWGHVGVYTTSFATGDLPPQLPGPLDAWAGDGPKEIRIAVPFARRVALTINLFDSHNERPPTLEILAGDRLVTAVQTEKGSGANEKARKSKGIRSTIKVDIPSQSLENDLFITIRNVEGSWVAIKNAELRFIPSNAEIAVVLAGWVLLIANMLLTRGIISAIAQFSPRRYSLPLAVTIFTGAATLNLLYESDKYLSEALSVRLGKDETGATIRHFRQIAHWLPPLAVVGYMGESRKIGDYLRAQNALAPNPIMTDWKSFTGRFVVDRKSVV